MFAACETTGCWNELKPLEVPDDVTVVCGPCGKPVTNITDIKPEEGRVLPGWISEMLTQPNSTN